MDIEFQTHGTFPHGDLLDDRACSDDVNTAQVYGFPYVIRTVGDSRIVRGSREVEQDTASNTPAQKAAAVMWDLRYLFIIQLFISCFNR